MKAVLISIKPKWCELIASGKKTVEVRKTKPKIDEPFKCYIYETQGRTETPFVDEEGHEIFKGRGQVVGEFVCDNINTIEFWNGCVTQCGNAMPQYMAQDNTCLTMEEIKDYIGEGKDGYLWHISDLVIYDKPKELGEFYQIGDNNIDYCVSCIYHETPACEFPCYTCNGNRKYLTRPFQSWGYVEESEGKE